MRMLLTATLDTEAANQAVTDGAQMPPLLEPFFHAGAKVDLRPVMSMDDLQTGLTSLGR